MMPRHAAFMMLPLMMPLIRHDDTYAMFTPGDALPLYVTRVMICQMILLALSRLPLYLVMMLIRCYRWLLERRHTLMPIKMDYAAAGFPLPATLPRWLYAVVFAYAVEDITPPLPMRREEDINMLKI